MTNAEIRVVLDEELTIDVPMAGKALGLSRNSSYRAANAGQIKTIVVGGKKRVPVPWLRQVLGLNDRAA